MSKSLRLDIGQDVVSDPNKVKLNANMYKLASDQGINFSQLLNRINPSTPGDTLDAFERQLRRFGIVCQGDPVNGIYASTIEEALTATPLETYGDSLQTDGSRVLFPELISKTARVALLKDQDYNVDDLLSATRNITQSSYKELYINDIADGKYAMGRVGEFGTFPRVQIGWSDESKSLVKRGVQVDMSYEFQREATLDILNIVINRIMLSQRTSLFKKAISTAVNGTIATKSSDLSTAISAGDHKLNYEAWLKWTASFAPYAPDTYYCSVNTALKIIMMDKPNVDPVAVMAALERGPITQEIKVGRGLWKNVTIFPFTDDTLPDDFILTLDRRYALERVIQAGTDLQETEKIITQQFTSVVISISDEISKIFDDAIMLLSLD